MYGILFQTNLISSILKQTIQQLLFEIVSGGAPGGIGVCTTAGGGCLIPPIIADTPGDALGGWILDGNTFVGGWLLFFSIEYKSKCL